MTPKRLRASAAALTAAMALVAATAVAAPKPAFTPIPMSSLEVTEGTITQAGPRATLRTASAGMRAVVRDGGRHHRAARLWFRYLGESETTEPLGSGQIRRQIGVKLRAADPCNLLYVMWHAYPDRVIEISVKRNPGQTTSSQCGNRGYTELAEIPLAGGAGTDDHGPHTLEVRSRRTAAGTLALALYADGGLRRRLVVPAELGAGLTGPIGVRSDNGDYLFRLSGSR